MACLFTAVTWNESDIRTVTDLTSLREAFGNVSTDPESGTIVEMQESVDLEDYDSLHIPQAAIVWLRGAGPSLTLDAGARGIPVILIDEGQSDERTVLHLSNIQITGGLNEQGEKNGGGISCLRENTEIVIKNGVRIYENEAALGGGIYIATANSALRIEDGNIEQNTAHQSGGGVFATCVEMTGGSIDGNISSGLIEDWTGGGGITTQSLFMSAGSITNNMSATNGGGIYIPRENLDNLTVAAGAVFSGNTAATDIAEVHPSDLALYNQNIKGTTWSIHNQGFNNYDIAYAWPSCGEFTDVTWDSGHTVTTLAEMRTALANASTDASNGTRIFIQEALDVYEGLPLQVPYGAKVWMQAGGMTLSTTMPDTPVIVMTEQPPLGWVGEPTRTVLHLSDILITGGNGTGGTGGGVVAASANITDPGIELVLKSGAIIRGNTGENGGGINLSGLGNSYLWIQEGAIIENNTAQFVGGGAAATCITMTGGEVRNNKTLQPGGEFGQFFTGGGGIAAPSFYMSGGIIRENESAQDGGGVLMGGGDITGSRINNNTAAKNGGGIWTMHVDPQLPVHVPNPYTVISYADISSNTAQNGGGIYTSRLDLGNLFVLNMTFANNRADNPVEEVHSTDLPLYNKNITGQNTWTAPFTQGWNNIDISYVPPGESEPCPVEGEQMVQIHLPVTVVPYAKVGAVTSRCCGTVQIKPGIVIPEQESENCNFTMRQRICARVPVEFGATVTPQEAHSTCAGNDCAECDNPPEPVDP